MTIVSTEDVCDGQPHIDGSSVSVIEIYNAFAREGMKPAGIANKYEVALPRVYEALAYYYDHALKMRQYRDDDSNESPDEHPGNHGLEAATSGRENWKGTTPTDAGESLFGGDDSDVNERVEDEWIDETTPEERVRSVIEHTYVPESVGYISDRARTSEETAHKHLLHLTEDGFVEETDDSERGTMYRRSLESLVLEQARAIRDRVDADTLVARVSEMQERIREYREETGADTPEDAALQDQLLGRETLQNWQATRRNLAFARVALALSAAEDAIEPHETFRHHLTSLDQLDRMFRHFDDEEQDTDDLE
ncbi:DUF433 domain-containing protein [Halogeometricum sp. CBA1124]|uniref:DUF433 domain-containing protein n=1 Tax=Halogeometricum sp. CBA1124 TaxID=2668071 RepID=UPI00142AD023|nr:DUF433 domain-containing protein [Halogeometricum sp. CBA1124]MUV56252.1 DUF433 domain-containing protein [Halogeometricum sp. CBA1124]